MVHGHGMVVVYQSRCNVQLMEIRLNLAKFSEAVRGSAAYCAYHISHDCQSSVLVWSWMSPLNMQLIHEKVTHMKPVSVFVSDGNCKGVWSDVKLRLHRISCLVKSFSLYSSVARCSVVPIGLWLDAVCLNSRASLGLYQLPIYAGGQCFSAC